MISYRRNSHRRVFPAPVVCSAFILASLFACYWTLLYTNNEKLFFYFENFHDKKNQSYLEKISLTNSKTNLKGGLKRLAMSSSLEMQNEIIYQLQTGNKPEANTIGAGHLNNKATKLFSHNVKRRRRSAMSYDQYSPPNDVIIINNGFTSESWILELEQKLKIPIGNDLHEKQQERKQSGVSAREELSLSWEQDKSGVYKTIESLCKDMLRNKTQLLSNHSLLEEHSINQDTGNAVEEHKGCETKKEDRLFGLWIMLYIFVVVWFFIAIAIICDDFFVPSLETICEKLNLSEDVAGATFMAAGSSAPELFTSVAGMGTGSDVGVGTIVGSAVFNLLVIIAMTSVLAGRTLQIDWRPFTRDSIFYGISVLVLTCFSWDGSVSWWESASLLLLYALYIAMMRFNSKLMEFMGGLPCNTCMEANEGRVSPASNNDADQQDVERVESSSSSSRFDQYQLPVLPGKDNNKAIIGITKSTCSSPEIRKQQNIEKENSCCKCFRPGNRQCCCCCCCCCYLHKHEKMKMKGLPKNDISLEDEVSKKQLPQKHPNSFLSKTQQDAEKEQTLCEECQDVKCMEKTYVGSSKEKDVFESNDGSVNNICLCDGSININLNDYSAKSPTSDANLRETSDDISASLRDEANANIDSDWCCKKSTQELPLKLHHSIATKGRYDAKYCNSNQNVIVFDANEIREQPVTYEEQPSSCKDLHEGVEVKPQVTASENTARPSTSSSQPPLPSASANEVNDAGAEESGKEDLVVFPCLPPIKRAFPVKPDSSNCMPSVKYIGEWSLYILSFPWICAFTWTIPNCSKEENRKWFLLSFLMSIIWIAGISYVMVEAVEMVGCLLNIDTFTMGLLVIAVGTSVPDAISSVLVAKEGHGDMAVSNAIGSNVFDINLGLGLPFFVGNLVTSKPIHLLTPLQSCLLDNLPLSVKVVPHVKFGFILLLVLILCVFVFILVRFKLNRAVGVLFASMYAVFMVYAFAQEKACYGLYC